MFYSVWKCKSWKPTRPLFGFFLQNHTELRKKRCIGYIYMHTHTYMYTCVCVQFASVWEVCGYMTFTTLIYFSKKNMKRLHQLESALPLSGHDFTLQLSEASKTPLSCYHLKYQQVKLKDKVCHVLSLHFKVQAWIHYSHTHKLNQVGIFQIYSQT